MTTAMYFLLMSLTLFVLPQLIVRFTLGYPIWDKRVRFVFYAAVLPIAWYIFIPKELQDIRQVNFLQHAIGGGVAIGFISLYFISIFKEKIPLWQDSVKHSNPVFLFILEAVFVYALVCIFGVANEMLEFLLDHLGIGIFSADRYDTWYDLLANTSGAAMVFIVYKLYSFVKSVN